MPSASAPPPPALARTSWRPLFLPKTHTGSARLGPTRTSELPPPLDAAPTPQAPAQPPFPKTTLDVRLYLVVAVSVAMLAAAVFAVLLRR